MCFSHLRWFSVMQLLVQVQLCFIYSLNLSPCGGLPLGVVLISNEKEESITKAFELLMEILPSDSFFNRGKKVPSIVMTDR